MIIREEKYIFKDMPYRPVLLYSGLKYGTMDMRKESMVYAWNIPGSGSRSLSDEEQGSTLR